MKLYNEYVLCGLAMFLVAVLVLFLALAPAKAGPHAGAGEGTAATLRLVLTSHSAGRSYGIYLEAGADAVCRFVRYRVSGAGVSAQTRPLRPGDGVVVRLGRGFVPGEHLLAIRPVGCRTAPVVARRVILNKASPDHGSDQGAGFAPGIGLDPGWRSKGGAFGSGADVSVFIPYFLRHFSVGRGGLRPQPS